MELIPKQRLSSCRPRKTPAPAPCFPIKSTNSFVEAFDRNLNTFWLSPTSREKNDRIVVRFEPETDIAAFTVYAGDPTGAQLVPKVIQMIKDRMETRTLTEGDLQRLIGLMEEYGSIDYALNRAQAYIAAAKCDLDSFEDSTAKRALSVAADYMVTRDR